MTGEIPQRVTCEVCGTSYDPRESRGWCPNPACGKWQHPDFPLSAGGQGGQQEAADGGVQAPTKICPGCGKEIRADANFCKFCSYEFPAQETDGDDGGEPEEAGLDQCPTCDADLSSIPAERLDDCPICGRDLEDLVADRGEPDVSPADLEACPACHADLTDIPSDMRRICPECRVSLEEAIAEHGVGGAPGAAGEHAEGAVAAGEPPDQGTQGAGGGSEAGAAEAGAGAAGAGAGTVDTAGGAAGKPGGGTEPAAAAKPVDTIKGIGSSYASRLGEQGVETVGDLLRADPATLSAATDISEKRLGEWVEKAPIDADDLGGTSAESGGEGTAGEQATQGQGQPPDAGTGKPSGGAGGQGASGQGGQASGGGGGQGAGGQRGTGAGAQGGQGRQGSGQGGGQQPQGHRRQQSGGQGTGSGQASGGNRPGGRSQGRSQAGGSGRGQADQGRAQGGGGRNAGAGREGAGARRRYDTLVFEVEGKEIRASPGDTVGREIRTAMVESGAPKEDAVYVHREHLRVERDQGTFYLVRLGQNSLKVNGEPVDQHGRMPVESGDNVSFSEVVSGTIRLE